MTVRVAAADVTLDGQALDAAVAARLLEVRVDLQSRLPDRCALRLADPELDLVDSDSFPLGAELEVSLAGPDATQATAVFTGQVASLEPQFDRVEAALVVRAYDRAHQLTRTRRSETYQQMSYADIARKIASRCGLTAGTIDNTGSPLAFVQQSNETDWEFLWRVGDEVGFQVGVEGRRLNFTKAGPRDADPVELTWGESLLEFRPRVTGVQQAESVEVRGWNPATKEAIVATATPEAGATAIGIERDDASSALGGGKLIVADRPVQTDAQATKLAESVAGQVADGWAEAEGVAIGDPRLKAGGQVAVEGVGSRFGGTYTLSAVAHVVRTGRGYETRFESRGRSSRTMLDLVGARAPAAWGRTVVVGLVTNNQDPDALGRIRVSYPVLGDGHEGWWARMTAPAAGTNRGLLMVPQPGDEVLLAFEHDDPDHPYILGSLWNGTAKPETLVHPDGSFALRSDKQVAIEAAEPITVAGDKTLTLSSAGDAKLTTSERKGDGAPGKVTVDAKGDGMFKSATALTLEGGGEVKITGGTEVKISGATAVKASAGSSEVKLEVAQLTIQGGMVKIQGTSMVQISGPQIMLG